MCDVERMLRKEVEDMDLRKISLANGNRLVRTTATPRKTKTNKQKKEHHVKR